MDRREFIKACSVVALMQVLWGCRRLPDLSGAKVPEIAEFEREVRLALSRAKGAFDLVQVPMPGPLEVHGASPVNRFGMAIDLDACDGCGKCILACMQENNIPLSSKGERDAGRFMHWIEMHGGAPAMCFHCGNARKGLPYGGGKPHSRRPQHHDVQALYRLQVLRGELSCGGPQVQLRG